MADLGSTVIVLTGKLFGISRKDLIRRINAASGTVHDKVTANTNLLVVAGWPNTSRKTTKLAAAQELGVKIIGEAEFGQLLLDAENAKAQARASTPEGRSEIVARMNALILNEAEAASAKPFAVSF